MFSAMIAIIRSPAGEPINLHRTYLSNGAKAPVASPRKLCSPAINGVQGTAIQLYEPDSRLAIGEGIESALAIRLLTGWPVWSSVNAGNLSKLQIPEHVREIQVWADADHAGIVAAERLRDRLGTRGLRVALMRPQEGMDPLDVYLGISSVSSIAAPISEQSVPSSPRQLPVRVTGDRCRCGACSEYFNSTGAFDEHRTGEYRADRRCMTFTEMLARGMRQSSNGWLTSR